MSESREAAKAEKKAAKSRAKFEKKLGKWRTPAAEASPAVGTPPPSGSADSRPEATPAERSAAAAERQVTLHRYRVWISLIAVIVALATFLITVKPWRIVKAMGSTPQAAHVGGDEPD